MQDIDKLVIDWLEHESGDDAREHELLVRLSDESAPPPRKVKTIAIFYHRFYAGGIERVISEQFSYFQKNGFKVVFLTEEPPSGNDFTLLPGVIREQVPKGSPQSRLAALREIFERHDIDIYYTHASFARQTLWDLVIVRYVLKRRVIVHAHGIFPCSLVWGEDDLQRRLEMYRLADHLIVLSRADAFYYRAYGINCTYLPNPVPAIPLQENLTGLRFMSKLVLVVGRVCAVKQTIEILRVASEMRTIDPAVHFLIVGSHDDAGYWRRFQMEYRKRGLGATVDFQDYTMDVDSLYRKGALLLMTSRLEGYPMVMAEAMGYGLPVVSYGMPYVELVREPESGVLMVPQGDAVGAAQCIGRLFGNRDLYEKLSRQARASYERIPSGADLQKAYAEVVEATIQGKEPIGEGLADARAAFESLMPQMRVCFRAYYDRGWRDAMEKIPKRTDVDGTGRFIATIRSGWHAKTKSCRILHKILSKIGDGVQCLDDNGIVYTISRLITVIGGGCAGSAGCRLVGEFLRYAVVGGIAFLADWATLVVSWEMFLRDVRYGLYVATALGFLVGLLVNYTLSLLFVFTAEHEKGKGRSFGAFFIFGVVGILGLLWTELGMWFGTVMLMWNYKVVKLLVAAAVLVWNYLGRKLLVFGNWRK